jgi:hypothetical protein
LLVAGLALAAGMVAVAVVWLGNQSPLVEYTSPALGASHRRVSLLVPKGWVEDGAARFLRNGNITLQPPKPPAWIPRWLRIGPFREPVFEDRLTVFFYTNELPAVFPDGEVGEELRGRYMSSYYKYLKSETGYYGVSYERRTKQEFVSTRRALYNSLRLVE